MDIKEVMFLIHPMKSPGPDGYSNSFFKVIWNDIGPKICITVQEFLATSEIHRQWNTTKLVFIPKVESPIEAAEFRHISCCNVIYKCISRLPCSRLKKVLPRVVDQSQGAFVSGRELIFNVLMRQEVARGYNRKHASLGA